MPFLWCDWAITTRYSIKINFPEARWLFLVSGYYGNLVAGLELYEKHYLCLVFKGRKYHFF